MIELLPRAEFSSDDAWMAALLEYADTAIESGVRVTLRDWMLLGEASQQAWNAASRKRHAATMAALAGVLVSPRGALPEWAARLEELGEAGTVAQMMAADTAGEAASQRGKAPGV